MVEGGVEDRWEGRGGLAEPPNLAKNNFELAPVRTDSSQSRILSNFSVPDVSAMLESALCKEC